MEKLLLVVGSQTKGRAETHNGTLLGTQNIQLLHTNRLSPGSI